MSNSMADQTLLVFPLPSGEELRVLTLTETTLPDGNTYAALIEEKLADQLEVLVAKGQGVSTIELIYAQKVGLEYRRVDDPAILDALAEHVAETLAAAEDVNPFQIQD